MSMNIGFLLFHCIDFSFQLRKQTLRQIPKEKEETMDAQIDLKY